jgi:hypothetical protein
MLDNNLKKDIKYINKDFSNFRQSLLEFAKSYFPNTYNDFNESSPGMMFIEMAAYVGDVLSYYTDNQLKESLLSYSQERSNLLQLAQERGYRPKNAVPSTVELDVYQLLPSIKSGSVYYPDWNYTLSINAEMILSAENSSVQFRTIEPVIFTSESISSNIQNDSLTVYQVDNNNNPIYYLLKTTAKAVSGTIQTATYTFGSPKRYDKIILSETNIIEILDIVDADGNIWYEVPYLAQDTIFETVRNDQFANLNYSASRDTAPYLLKLKKVSRRFETRVNADNTITIQFGAGVSTSADEELIPNPDLVGSALYSANFDYSIDPSNFLYSKTYGLAPSNTTLTVRYVVGGGIESNVQANTITTISSVTFDNDGSGLNQALYTRIRNSVAVNNTLPAVGGKSLESIDEIRFNAIANFASQNRTVTVEDYIIRAYSMPAKFGSVSKAYITKSKDLVNQNGIITTNDLALDLYVLGYDINKNLTFLNTIIKSNLATYLDQYRIITDAINIKNAYIVNIGIEFSIITLPGFNSNEVLLKCISKLKDIFDINKWQINQPIIISKLYAELDNVDGVQTVSNIIINNLAGSDIGYSNNRYDIQAATRNGIIYPSLDPCIFEIKYPNKDIKGKVTT